MEVMFPRRLLVASVATLVAAIVITTATTAENTFEFQNQVEVNHLNVLSKTPYEAKLHRAKRQTRRNPNIFGLFFQLIGETRRDIQKTFNDIAREVESGLVDENTIDNTTTAAPEGEGATSERPRVSRQELMRILSRNWRGLTRLFNREVDIALNQSNRNAAEARRSFWNSLAPFLEPATTTTRSTTTARSG